MTNYAAGEATKKRPVFERLLSLSATYVQGSSMPSVKYSGRVETDVFQSQLGRGETGRKPACRENNN